MRDTFPNLSDVIVKEGIFVGPQIKKVVFEDNFESKFNFTELSAWRFFERLVHTVWVTKKKDEHYPESIQILLQNYQKLGCY